MAARDTPPVRTPRVPSQVLGEPLKGNHNNLNLREEEKTEAYSMAQGQGVSI